MCVCVCACMHACMRVVRVKQNASDNICFFFVFFTNLNIMQYTMSMCDG